MFYKVFNRTLQLDRQIMIYRNRYNFVISQLKHILLYYISISIYIFTFAVLQSVDTCILILHKVMLSLTVDDVWKLKSIGCWMLTDWYFRFMVVYHVSLAKTKLSVTATTPRCLKCVFSWWGWQIPFHVRVFCYLCVCCESIWLGPFHLIWWIVNPSTLCMYLSMSLLISGCRLLLYIIYSAV